MGAIARIALSAVVVFGFLFGAIVVGMRLHRAVVDAPTVGAAPEGVTLQVGGDAPQAAAGSASALREFLGIAPSRRLEAALAERDTRFLAVQGAVLVVPGVADAAHGFDPARLHAIPGTTPAPTSDAHAAMIVRARRYAVAYNTLLLGREAYAPSSSAAAAASPDWTAPSAEGATR